jgi:hypothetical protein
MVASMFRLFGFWEFGRRAGGSAIDASRAASPTAYTEALLAGWVAPLSEFHVEADPVTPATEDEEPDSADFLARVYLHQEC